MELIVYSSFVLFSVLALGLHHLARKTEKDRQQNITNSTFVKFQRSFYFVYFLALLGDWLQGPYVYKLYSYYGYEEDSIAVLYVTGFASSVLLGTFTGSLADMVGRRKVALAYCLIYVFCCATKLSSDFNILLLGRVFGGVATSMLFSAFESWYVYEHAERHGFPAEWISATFSFTTLCNGLIAIFAGVASNFFAEGIGFGPVAPFVMAMPPLILCFLVVFFTWPENYGKRQDNLMKSCCQGLSMIFADKNVLMLGVLQTVVESCMYIFVFLWTPVLAPAAPPYGMVFAVFMVAVMIGSSLYSLAISHGATSGHTLMYSLALVAPAMAASALISGPENTSGDLTVIYFAFVLFEVAIGIYFPSISTLKSQYVPEACRANIMNWFRVPMNVITCVALLCLKIEFVSKNKGYVFLFCFLLSMAGFVVVKAFNKSVGPNTPEKKAKLQDETGVAAASASEKEQLLA